MYRKQCGLRNANAAIVPAIVTERAASYVAAALWWADAGMAANDKRKTRNAVPRRLPAFDVLRLSFVVAFSSLRLRRRHLDGLEGRRVFRRFGLSRRVLVHAQHVGEDVRVLLRIERPRRVRRHVLADLVQQGAGASIFIAVGEIGSAQRRAGRASLQLRTVAAHARLVVHLLAAFGLRGRVDAVED